MSSEQQQDDRRQEPSRHIRPDLSAFPIWEANQKWFTQCLRVLKGLSAHGLVAVLAVASLPYIAVELIRSADKLTVLAVVATAFVELMILALGIVALLLERKQYVKNCQENAHSTAEPGDARRGPPEIGAAS
jgi:hypothetical protein